MKCNLCGREIEGYGNNPAPLSTNDKERCCDKCNGKYVIAARIYELNHHPLTTQMIKNAILDIRINEGYEQEV